MTLIGIKKFTLPIPLLDFGLIWLHLIYVQIVSPQINKAGEDSTQPMEGDNPDGGSEDEDEDEDVDEQVYGEDEDESQRSSGDADDD